jgi:hypothetical protein
MKNEELKIKNEEGVSIRNPFFIYNFPETETVIYLLLEIA